MALFVELLEMEEGRLNGAHEVNNLVKYEGTAYVVNSFDDEMKDRLLTKSEFVSIITEMSVGNYLKFIDNNGYMLAVVEIGEEGYTILKHADAVHHLVK